MLCRRFDFGEILKDIGYQGGAGSVPKCVENRRRQAENKPATGIDGLAPLDTLGHLNVQTLGDEWLAGQPLIA